MMRRWYSEKRGLVSKVAGEGTEEVERVDEERVDEDDEEGGQVGLQEVAEALVDVDGDQADEVGGLEHVVEDDGGADEKEDEEQQQLGQELGHLVGRLLHEAVAPVDVLGVDEVVDLELLGRLVRRPARLRRLEVEAGEGTAG